MNNIVLKIIKKIKENPKKNDFDNFMLSLIENNYTYILNTISKNLLFKSLKNHKKEFKQVDFDKNWNSVKFSDVEIVETFFSDYTKYEKLLILYFIKESKMNHEINYFLNYKSKSI